jgi:hypothetical protein
LEARRAAEVLTPGEVSHQDGVGGIELIFFNDVPAVVDEMGGFGVRPTGSGPLADRAGDAASLAVVGVDEGLVAESRGVGGDAQQAVF